MVYYTTNTCYMNKLKLWKRSKASDIANKSLGTTTSFFFYNLAL